jgi:type II secretory pathway component PulF
MKFKYRAADSGGKITESEIEGSSVADVLGVLASKGLKPITIAPKKSSQSGSKGLFGGGISIKEQIFLTRYLGLMLKVGMDLFSAINILINNFENPATREFLKEVKLSLEKGHPLYTTFAHFPNYFSPVFINLVRAGEESGTLQKVFEDLSVNLEREQNLRNNIRSALFYPALLFIMASFVLLFLVTFAIPRIASVFEGTGSDIPLFSKIVFSTGSILGAHPWLIFGGFFAILIGLFVFFRTAEGKRILYIILNHIPVVRTVVRKVALQRFAVTLSSLLQAGLPILDSLEISADVVGGNNFRDAIRRVAREGLSKGKTLGESFQREPVFPGVVTSLITISERAGQLPEVLETLARFYEEEVNHGIKRLVVFLEPVMLMLIGLVIGLIALAIIVPIYQLVGAFR